MEKDFLIKNLSNFKQISIKIKKFPHFKGELPSYESTWASGFDVRAQLSSKKALAPFERSLIPTGLAFEIPRGFELQVRPRSGLSLKTGLSIPNSPGTIDSDYRGELKVIVINVSKTELVIEDQQRVAQVVLCPIFQAQFVLTEELSHTTRGEKGFGSTGVLTEELSHTSKEEKGFQSKGV